MIVLGDTAGGLALLDRSLAIEPRAETMLSKAIIIGQKNPALVPGYMHSALSLNPAYLPALSTLAIYYSEVTPLKDSALYYASIISEKAPNLEITLLSLMSVYLSFSKYDSLIAVADRLAEKNPGYAYGFNNRGYAKMKKGNYDGARADIYHSLMLDSTNSYAYKNLGLLSIELKQKDSACFYLQKATAKGFRKLYGNEVDSLSTIYCR
jgi:tetratricopeptide (TPR) repeat protein